MASALMSIAMSIIAMMIFRGSVNNILTIISAGSLIGYAVGERRAYKQIENLPILGFLIVLHHKLGDRPMTPDELAENIERRRMVAQQYEESGFVAPMGM